MTGGLRIAHVQPMTLDLYGHADEEFGTTVRYSVSNLAEAQARMGDRPTVHLLTSGQPKRFHRNGVEVRFHACLQPPTRAPIQLRFARQFSRSMVSAIRRDEADVLHFHGIRQLHLMFAAVAWRARRLGLPLASQDRGNREVGRTETWAQRLGVQRSDALLATSQDTIDLVQRLGAPASRVHLVPNGYDPEVFSPTEVTRAPSRPLRILVVSRLNADKDPLTMADALSLVRQRVGRLEVTVISRGPFRDAVARRLADAGVSVRMIEQVPQPELAGYYRWADVFVLTSLREGFNQTVLEAMACALPVVATDIPGTREAVGDGGVLVPTRDPEAVADAVEELTSDTATYEAARRRAAERVRGLTWDAVARQLHSIYIDLL